MMGKHKVRSRPAPTDPPQPFRGPRYAENEERVSTDETACAICGRGIKRSEERWYAEVVDGGSRFARVDEHADPALDLTDDVVTLTAALCDIESVSKGEAAIADAIESVSGLRCPVT